MHFRTFHLETLMYLYEIQLYQQPFLQVRFVFDSQQLENSWHGFGCLYLTESQRKMASDQSLLNQTHISPHISVFLMIISVRRIQTGHTPKIQSSTWSGGQESCSCEFEEQCRNWWWTGHGVSRLKAAHEEGWKPELSDTYQAQGNRAKMIVLRPSEVTEDQGQT